MKHDQEDIQYIASNFFQNLFIASNLYGVENLCNKVKSKVDEHISLF